MEYHKGNTYGRQEAETTKGHGVQGMGQSPIPHTDPTVTTAIPRAPKKVQSWLTSDVECQIS